MFNLYERAVMVEKDSIYKKYKDGAVIIYQYIPGIEGFVNVFGEAPHDEVLDVSRCFRRIMDKCSEYTEGVRFNVLKIPPAKKTDLSANGKFVLEKDNFWMDWSGAIKNEYEKYKQVYGADAETVTLYYAQSKDRNCIIFYGSSIEDYPKKDIQNSVRYIVRTITYENYLREKAKVCAEHAKSCDASGNATDQTGEKGTLCEQISAWCKRVVFKDFYAYMAHRVKGQPELVKVLAGVYTYLSCIAEGKTTDSNMLLAAPSGCGKTETFRALRDYFREEIPDLPVYQVDMTSITEEGYKGADVKEIVLPLVMCDEPDGIGLVFLDEFDKKLIPSYTSSGTNVNAAIQAQILTLLEGRKMRVPYDGDEEEIDTTNTMFVGLGSFDVCREKRTVKTHALGFGSIEEDSIDHYDEITREEMIELGATNELLGRFSSIVNYYKLSDAVVDEIIDRNVERITHDFGYHMTITKEKRTELHNSANGKFGCRLLYNDIRDQALTTYAGLLMENTERDACTIVLDANGVVNLEEIR